MFNNIGKKIKNLAELVTVVGIGLSLFAGLMMIAASAENSDDIGIVLGVVVMVFGSLISWVSSFILYAYGEITERVCSLERHFCKGDKKKKSLHKPDDGEERVLCKDEVITKMGSEYVRRKCELCETDDVQTKYCTLESKNGTRYRFLCDECMASYDVDTEE